MSYPSEIKNLYKKELKDYNGPIWFGKKVFQNAGANIMMSAGSGTPFSKQSNITQEAASGINDRSTLEGSLNGSRLPWQFRLSAKFNKEFEIKWSDKKKSHLNRVWGAKKHFFFFFGNIRFAN